MKKLLVKPLALAYQLRDRWNGNLYNFRRAVKRAKKLAANGRRRYVFFIAGKYRVYSRKDIQRLKNAGIFKRHTNIEMMSKICLFDTQEGINKHPNPNYRRMKV